MIRVILLDSESGNYIILKKIVNCFNKNNVEQIKIIQIDKDIDLNQEINDISHKKVYIINIDSKKNYVDIFRFIRKIDMESEIILIAKNKSMVRKKHCDGVYKIFDFIVHDDNFTQVLKSDLSLIINNNFSTKKFIYKNHLFNLCIYCKNILYIYRDTIERKLVVVTNYNEYHVNLSLNEVNKMLGSSFCQCHRACIVNVSRVEKFDWCHKRFILDNGKIIYLLSKNYRDNIEMNTF